MERVVSSAALQSTARFAPPPGLLIGLLLSVFVASFAPFAARADDGAARPESIAHVPLSDRALALSSPATSMHPMVTLESSPAAVSGVHPLGTPLTNAQLNSGSASIVDYRAWLGAGRTSFGLGLTTSAYRDTMIAGPLLVSPGAPRLGVGLRYQFSRDSQLTFDSLASSRSDDLPPRMRVGMEFRSPPSQVLGMARGTFMRVQLSSDSQVSVNWRGGKLGLALRSQF